MTRQALVSSPQKGVVPLSLYRSFLSCLAALLITGVGGCATDHSNPGFDQAILSAKELDRIKTTYIDADVELAFASAPDKIFYRNTVLEARVRYIDAHYAALETKLRTNRSGLTFLSDVSTLTLNSIGALTGTAATKAILHAISAGIVGGHAAFEKDFFQDQAPNVIIPEMQSLRKEQYTLIIKQMALPINQYSLQAALADADRYLRAGSVTEALISLANKSGSTATKAAAETKKVIDDRYNAFNALSDADKVRQAILKWWHADDKTNTPLIQAVVPLGVTGATAITAWLLTATADELKAVAAKLSVSVQ
jgi:hypothetical protein